MGEPGYYTEHGRFDSVVKYLSGGDVPLRLEGLLERYVRDRGAARPALRSGEARAGIHRRHQAPAEPPFRGREGRVLRNIWRGLGWTASPRCVGTAIRRNQSCHSILVNVCQCNLGQPPAKPSQSSSAKVTRMCQSKRVGRLATRESG
jgi:hypothetical protein